MSTPTQVILEDVTCPLGCIKNDVAAFISLNLLLKKENI